MITAEDNDSYLSHAIFQLIYDDEVMNSIEILESVVNFSEGLMSSNIFGVLQLPMGTTNGKWDIRLFLLMNLVHLQTLVRPLWEFRCFKTISTLKILF